MKRGLSLLVAAMFLAPFTVRAQETKKEDSPKKEETQPSQGAATPEKAAKPAPPAPPKAELYGTLNVNTQWTRSRGATGLTGAAADVAPRLAVSTDSTNVGVRGAFQLQDWVKAEYQCETSANIDGIGVSGICNRNSKLGFSGTFGTVFYGNWDTPFKALAYGTKADDPFGNTDVFDFANLLGSPGFNTRTGGWKQDAVTATQPASFDVRANNSIAYWTPKVSGLYARFQYGVNEFKSVNGNVSPKMWSASAVYDAGPVSIVASFEDHEDAYGLAAINPTFGTGVTRGAFGATAANPAPSSAAPASVTAPTTVAHTEDRAWRVGAGWEIPLGDMGATTVNGTFERLQYLQGAGPAGSIADYDRYAWQVALKHRMGNHELRARYTRANDGVCKLVGGGGCSTADFGAQMYAVGYAYYFAKTTQMYLHYVDVKNRANAQYTFAVGGAPAVTAVKRGQDPQAIALGIRYAF